MSDRWIPVLAATVGVLGGIGGALIGGLIANESQKDRLESERDAAREALRQDAYASYLETANTLFLVAQLVRHDPDQVSDEDVTSALDAAFSAQAGVEVVAPAEIRTATNKLTTLMGLDKQEWAKLTNKQWTRIDEQINTQRDKWIDLTQKDLGIDTGE